MNACFAIARAQLSGRGPALLVAFALGLLPVGAAYVSPEFAEAGPSLVIIVWAVTQVMALLAGVSLFGEDLGSGRMAFFFSRPVSSVAVWAGKLSAAAAFVLAFQTLMLLPTMYLWPITWRYGGGTIRVADYGLNLAELCSISLLLVTGGAATGIVGRGRSRWLLLDALGASAIAAAIFAAWQRVDVINERFWMVFREFYPRYTPKPIYMHFVALREALSARTDMLLWAVVVVAVVAFAVATAAGIVGGRGSARRAHSAASIALWMITIPAAGGFLLYVHWFLNPL